MRQLTLLPTILGLLLLLAGAQAQSAMFERQFSVDVGISYQGQPEELVRLSVGEQRMRMELVNGVGEVVLFELTDDKAVVRVLVPDEMMYAYIEMDLEAFIHDDGSDVLFAATAPDHPEHACQALAEIVSCEHVANQAIDGVEAELWELEFTDEDGEERLQRLWFDREREVVLRLEDDEGTVLEFRNHQFEPQAEELFEVPEGYQRFDPPPGAPLPGN